MRSIELGLLAIVAFTGEQAHSEYLKGRVCEAKSALNKLSILKILVDDFSALEESKTIDNLIFWQCASADGDHPDRLSMAELAKLELYLRKLDILNWPQRKKDNITAKLQSNTLSGSMAGYTEVTIAGYLADRFGSNLVEYEPPLASGGFSDIRLTQGAQPIYIEVTALNTGETERKFGEIFNQVARYIWSQMNEETIVRIEIDTGVLPSDDVGIDVGSSVSMIIHFLKTTNMISLFDGRLSIHGLRYLAQLGPDKTLYDWKPILDRYSVELSENSELEPTHSFLKSVSGKQFVNCPVASFWSIPSRKDRIVEVAGQEISPSPVSSLERVAFLNHVERKLKEELNQMQPGEINLIVLRASDWSILGYEKGKLEAVFFFPEIRSRIEEFMAREKNPDLSAILVYEDSFPNAQIVMNPYSSGRSRTNSELIEGIT